MQRVGRYQLQDKLGEGGMGVVYKARDRDTDVPVAIKLLHRHRAADSVLRTRFLREAEIGQMVDHPGVMRVYEHGEVRLPDGMTSLFMAMEFVPGRNLQLRTAFQPLTVRQVAAVGQQIASALAGLHAHRVVHRDVKPGNVQVSHDGTIKLLDFGLAKPLEVDARQWPRAGAPVSHAGVALGTVPYSAPEQLAGAAAAPSADLFSLGVILYQQLAGRVPYPAQTTIDFLAAVERPPAPLHELRAAVPERFDQLVRRLVSARPAGRPESAAQVAAELAAIAGEIGEDETAAAPAGREAVAPAAPAQRRHWWWPF